MLSAVPKKFRSEVCRRFIDEPGAAVALAIKAAEEALIPSPVVDDISAFRFDTKRDTIERCSASVSLCAKCERFCFRTQDNI